MTAKMALYQSNQIRLCEQRAIADFGLSADELMLRAGTYAFTMLRTLYPTVRKIAVFCGSGNNAGDGYVLARLAHQQGYSVLINQYKSVEKLPPAACHAALRAIASGVPCQSLEEAIDSEAELIVDALLGLGLQDDVKGPLATAINQINDSQLPILALDLPSGLDADTGCVMGLCVRASATLTFIAPKLGQMTLNGPEHCGRLFCSSLDLESCLALIPPAAFVLNEDLARYLLPPRLKNSHKGNFGHVLIIGGGLGMPGSVYLAAQAALRTGAGMVTIATRPEHVSGVLPLLAEVMIYGIEEVKALEPLLAKATVCIIGPGLGEDEWARALFSQAMASQLPMVIDASALRLLAQNPQHDDNWILTPHPGEAASLLNCSSVEIQNDRYQAVNLLQQYYGGNIILKGSGSLLCTDKAEVSLCDEGNPGMASAGMGDTLSGILAGLAAQGLSLANAAKVGVWLHARAADRAAAEKGERGLIASDLMPYLHRLVNQPFFAE